MDTSADDGVYGAHLDDELSEATLADLLPTASWLLIKCAPSALLSDLQLIMELLPPERMSLPTAPLLFTAACVVQNAQRSGVPTITPLPHPSRRLAAKWPWSRRSRW